jgi:hypothetical protein
MYHQEERAEQEEPGNDLMNSEGCFEPEARVQQEQDEQSLERKETIKTMRTDIAE